MHCLYCGARLPLLRDLQHGDYCSDAHREAWESLQHECEAASDDLDALAAKPSFGPAMRLQLYPLRSGCSFIPGPRIVIPASAPAIRVDVRSIRSRAEVVPPGFMDPRIRPRADIAGRLRAGWSAAPVFVKVVVLVTPLLFLSLVPRIGPRDGSGQFRQ